MSVQTVSNGPGSDFQDLVSSVSGVDKEHRRIEVTWYSTRSDEIQRAEGQVQTLSISQEGEFYLQLIRSDNQMMWIEEDGNIYSKNSEFPLTGTVNNIRVLE